MGLMKELEQRAGANLAKGKTQPRKSGAIISATDLARDLKLISEHLTGQKLKRIISKMNTAVRSAAVRRVRRASSASSIGESMKGKMTRGDWKNPSVVVRPGAAVGTEYLAGGWYGKVLSSRGNKKPSMANNGGEVGRGGGGNTGIISRNDKVRGGYVGITGPRHSGSNGDDGDNGKHGYNYAHMLEFGGNHVNWDSTKRRTSSLQARPFLAPAVADSQSKQIAILKHELKKLGKD